MADNSFQILEKAGPQPATNEKNVEAAVNASDDAVSVHSETSSVQAGVQKALILKKAWSHTTLGIAFARYTALDLILMESIIDTV
jgi:hypothetical protein